MDTQIVIRHLVGSKTSQIEQFCIQKFSELTIGREPGASIRFDSTRDDRVSRKHAAIRVEFRDPPGFKLVDLDSSNGTFLNGERIAAETELLPGDLIELGLGGPKFVFDVEPRPANLLARTRALSAAGSAPTRVIDSVEAPPPPAPTFVPRQSENKPSVGRDTVMRLLSDQRQATSRVVLYALAGVLAVILLAGGTIYYKNQRDVAEEAAQIERQNIAQATKNQELALQIQQQQQLMPALVHQQLGENAREIADKYSNSTVAIDMQWGLNDRDTGKPLYHKTFWVGGAYRPAYVSSADGKHLYRWLTTEDEEHTNFRVGSHGKGTGFIISAEGLILTNKHLAAGWKINYNAFSDYDTGSGLLFDENEQIPPLPPNSNKKKRSSTNEYDKYLERKLFNVSTDNKEKFRDLITWYPDSGGPLFDKDQPKLLVDKTNDKAHAATHAFEGSNEVLEVRFPGARMNVSARLIRASTDADVALIKIDATENLAPIPLAADNDVKIGGHVIVLGYPGFSVHNIAVVPTIEKGEVRNLTEDIPQPTVNEGIISSISLPMQQVGNLMITGSMGNVYQMTVVSGPGNSGGPVFNETGKVIGLFTYASAVREGITPLTYAVPIIYARDLLRMQRTSN